MKNMLHNKKNIHIYNIIHNNNNHNNIFNNTIFIKNFNNALKCVKLKK